MTPLLVAILLVGLTAAASGCGDDSNTDQRVSQPASPASSGESGASSSSSEDSHSGGDGNGGSGDDRSDDDTVSRENPGFTETAFDISRNLALSGAHPLDAVTWNTRPTIAGGALEASGILNEGVSLFDPKVDGEGAGFIVYYKGVEEPLVLLLPDLGPTQIWESYYTTAPMESEFEGSSFTFRAYSPLFMDVGPSDLEIRLFGLDANRADALLAIEPVGVE